MKDCVFLIWFVISKTALLHCLFAFECVTCFLDSVRQIGLFLAAWTELLKREALSSTGVSHEVVKVYGQVNIQRYRW